jgi:hypothetical protein
MKRIIVCALAMAFSWALLATPAGAAVRHFEGSITGGGKVEFDVEFRRGVPKLAGNFEFNNMPVTCETGGNTRVRISTGAVINVVDGKFVYNFRSFRGRFAGRIKGNDVQALGKVKYGPSDLSETRTGCTTNGNREWRAHL